MLSAIAQGGIEIAVIDQVEFNSRSSKGFHGRRQVIDHWINGTNAKQRCPIFYVPKSRLMDQIAKAHRKLEIGSHSLEDP